MTALLCVDLSYQAYRATCANPRLTCDGTFTGGLYGFFMFLGKAVRETRATRLAVCLDTKPYVRSAEYPQYKKLRKAREDPEVKERYETSKRLILETLFTVGAPVYALEGYEADDLTAGLAMRYRHRFDHVYAASNDSDLYQCLQWDSFSIYKTDIDAVVTRKTLMRDLKVTPHQYMLATALMGTHNDIEGIPGVGVKTAFRAVLDTSQLRALRSKWGDLIDRNLDLIRLPHASMPPDAVLMDLPQNQFNPRDLYQQLGQWDIDVTDSMVRAFEATAV